MSGYLIHSTGLWKKHKYIKKIGDRYYYQGEHVPSGAEQSKYTKGDPDFDDELLSEKTRIGDTDFHAFYNAKGQLVIRQEDMKWIMPEGSKVTPELVKNIEAFDKEVYASRFNNKGEYVNTGIVGDEWNEKATRAINSSIHPGETKGESRSLDEMAKAVIRGEYGNGQERKEALGENYADIQKRVNEMMKGGTKSSSKSKEVSPTAINAADKKATKSSADKKATESKKEESREQRMRNAYRDRTATHSAIDSGEEYLEHFGILGMRWGVRRYQNSDGTLTTAGKKRYGSDEGERSEKSNTQNSQNSQNSSHGQNQNPGQNSSKDIAVLQDQINELKQIVKQQTTMMQQQSQSQQNTSRSEIEELQNAVRRLELEKRYRELSQPPQQQSQNQQNDRLKELEIMVRTKELEQRYNDLMTPKCEKRNSEGKKFVKDILYKSGMAVGTAVTTYAIGKAVNKMLGQDVVSVRGGNNNNSNNNNSNNNSNRSSNSSSSSSNNNSSGRSTRSLFGNRSNNQNSRITQRSTSNLFGSSRNTANANDSLYRLSTGASSTGRSTRRLFNNSNRSSALSRLSSSTRR